MALPPQEATTPVATASRATAALGQLIFIEFCEDLFMLKPEDFMPLAPQQPQSRTYSG